MALINCVECDREVSDRAPSCVGCGAPLEARPSDTGPVEVDSEKIERTPVPLNSEQVPITRRVRTHQPQAVVRAAVAIQLRRLEPKFDETTLSWKNNVNEVTVAVSHADDGWLLTARHNLRQKNYVIGMLVVAVLTVLGLLYSGWILLFLVFAIIFDVATKTKLSTSTITQCFDNVANELGESGT